MGRDAFSRSNFVSRTREGEKRNKKKKLDLVSPTLFLTRSPSACPFPPLPPPLPRPPKHETKSKKQYHYRPGTISAFFSRALARHASRRRSRAPVRVYMDGCFDMMHYGHANALRQAKALGDVLVVGLIPDSQIRMYKVRELSFSSSFFFLRLFLRPNFHWRHLLSRFLSSRSPQFHPPRSPFQPHIKPLSNQPTNQPPQSKKRARPS